MKNVGCNMIMYVIVLVVVGFVVVVKKGIEFDDSMRKVKVILGVIGEEFEVLKKKVCEMGVIIKFSVLDLVEVLNYMVFVGWDFK